MQVLGSHKFHLLAFHVIQGNQIIVRGENRKTVESVLNCLKVACFWSVLRLFPLMAFKVYKPNERTRKDIAGAHAVVERLVNTNPGLNLIPGGLLFLLFKSTFWYNFSNSFLELPIIKLQTERITVNLLFKLSYRNSIFALALSYLNTVLNT